MNYAAVSIGSDVPPDEFNGVIQSTFTSSLNIHLAQGNRLITLFFSDYVDLPQGIRLPPYFPLQNLTLGLHAFCRDGVLRFDLSPITIDLRNARVWQSQVTKLDADIHSPAVHLAWNTVWERLNQRQIDQGSQLVISDLFGDDGSIISKKMKQPIQALLSACNSLDVQRATRSAEQIIATPFTFPGTAGAPARIISLPSFHHSINPRTRCGGVGESGR